VALNYVMTVYGIWYSAQLFEDNGWTPPTTWAEAIELGKKAKEKGLYLFGSARKPQPITARPRSPRRSRKAATKCVSPWTSSARGYPEVDYPAFQAVLRRAVWSGPGRHDEARVARVPSSPLPRRSGRTTSPACCIRQRSWIENEMKPATKGRLPDELRACRNSPSPTMASCPRRPCTPLPASRSSSRSARSTCSPAARNLSYTALSQEAATKFAKSELAPAMRSRTLCPPKAASAPPALVSQSKLLADAGNDVLTGNSLDLCGRTEVRTRGVEQLP